jgi:transposase-like protein
MGCSRGVPLATIQTCIIHLIRGTFRYASKKHWDQIAREFKPISTAPSATAARAAFEDFEAAWAAKYRAISEFWRSAWEQFTAFLDCDVEIRKVLCSTNAIESLNAKPVVNKAPDTPNSGHSQDSVIN